MRTNSNVKDLHVSRWYHHERVLVRNSTLCRLPSTAFHIYVCIGISSWPRTKFWWQQEMRELIRISPISYCFNQSVKYLILHDILHSHSNRSATLWECSIWFDHSRIDEVFKRDRNIKQRSHPAMCGEGEGESHLMIADSPHTTF